jgi:uncharacterized protein YkwD
VVAVSKPRFAALAQGALGSAAGRRLAISISAAALLIGILPAVPAGAPVHVVTAPTAGGAWLNRVNQWRLSTGVSTLSENTLWSSGDYNHAVYMVKNNLVTHYETPGVPYYTVDGDTAARNGNIQVSSTTGTSDQQAIDWWMAAPFHAMAMMDPRLTQTGFGSYRDATTSPWQEGAAFDTSRGNPFTGGSYPVYFPGNGSSEPLTTYGGGEFPDPLQACPGYSAPTGLPVFIEIGGNVGTTAGAVHSFTGNGVALAHCVIDSSNGAVSSYLYTRGAVILVPQQPLVSGVKYVVALTVNGVPHTWSFTVGTFFGVTSISPNGGPLAGGTTVTIDGGGFTNATSVKFGTSAAASFAVVNDSVITAVSPVHAAGMVDVTVTTAAGTSATSAADQFTYETPCTSLSGSLAPPTQAVAGTRIVFTGSASGCPAPQYRFWIQPPGGVWGIVQDYSALATYNWTSTGTAGVYRLEVDARDLSSGVPYDLVANFTYTITGAANCATAALSPSLASPRTPGTQVIWTGSSTTCPSPRYRFWELDPGSRWSMVQDYSAATTYTWNSPGIAGSYKFEVDVRDASESTVYDVVAGATYVLQATIPSCTNAGVAAAPTSPGATGATVTLTGSSATCPNPRYRFWIQDPGRGWSMVQDYSASTTHSWPQTGLAGSYRLEVDIRDASETTTYDVVANTTYVIGGCTAAGLTANPANTAAHGTPITVNATSTCPGTATYLFWIKAPSGIWQVVQPYGTGNTLSWTPATAGTYSLEVDVRDQTGTDTYEKVANITYVVT